MLLPDIEDLYIEERREKRENKIIIPTNNIVTENNKISNENYIESFIPCIYTIYIRTWGCTHNTSDKEYMSGILVENGYKLTEDKNLANIWILNSCTVKNPSEDSLKYMINEAKLKNIPIVITGCIPQSEPNMKYGYSNISLVGLDNIDKICYVVEECLKGNIVKLLEKNGKKLSLDLPKIRRNPYIEIIAISSGCLNQCTYCKTKHARGELGSYEPDMIINRAKKCFNDGIKEIWLTSEDIGAYGYDINSSLPQLLYKLLEIIPNDCMIRIGMTNPPYIMKYMKEMAIILNHPRVYSFIHIPVQSGSDSVLSDMNREYNIDDFCSLVNYLIQNVPNIHIATDIICAFPTETEEDFNMTCNLVEMYKFNSLFINQYYPRPGTVAAKMCQIDTKIAKKRTKILSQLFRSYLPYTNRINNIYHILLTELSSDKLYLVGHNKSYEQILVKCNESLLGTWVQVRISETGKFYMKGEII